MVDFQVNIQHSLFAHFKPKVNITMQSCKGVVLEHTGNADKKVER